MASPRRGFQARSPRRIVDWGLGPAAVTQNASATGKVLWSLGTSPQQNLTVVRTRGHVTVMLQIAGGVGEGFSGAHGIYMMTEDAFAVGATAALDPQGDSNSDMWLWHSFFDVRLITATLADAVNAPSLYSRIEIDSKAMRKNFDPERVMVGVTGLQESGTCQVEINADTRQLFKS